MSLYFYQTLKRIILNDIWENNRFCESVIEGLRRAFLFVDCVNQELADCVCLCRSVRVLTETEWNTRGTNVCSLYENFFYLFLLFWFFRNLEITLDPEQPMVE